MIKIILTINLQSPFTVLNVVDMTGKEYAGVFIYLFIYCLPEITVTQSHVSEHEAGQWD